MVGPEVTSKVRSSIPDTSQVIDCAVVSPSGTSVNTTAEVTSWIRRAATETAAKAFTRPKP